MRSKMIMAAFAVAASMSVSSLSAKSLPAGVVRLSVEPDRSVYQAGERQNGVVRITITAPEPGEQAKNKRTPVNLAVVLDRSGSMSGDKIEKARDAATTALNMLSEGDIFSLVVYDDKVSTLVPAVFVDDKEGIAEKIRGIESGGGTALFAGVSSGAAEVRKNLGGRYVNRIILLSDGLANVGPGSPEELGRLGASLVKEGISVSTVGIGNGYNEDLMTAHSHNSDGNFYFVENSNDLPMIFARELDSALVVAAKSVRLRIECPETVRPFGIIGHDCRVNSNSIDMFFNQLYGGNSKTLLLQVEIPPGASEQAMRVAAVSLQYKDPLSDADLSVSGEAKIAFSAEKKKVEESLNVDILDDVAVKQNAELKAQAISQADKGDMPAAAATMRKSAENLRKVSKISGNKMLVEEAEHADMAAEEIEVQAEDGKASLDSNLRKKLKTENYQELNDQKYRQ